MKNKKLGIGSISLLLVIIAFIWAFEIFGVCVGDNVLATFNIPTWSNSANASGTHYTIFYSFIFLIPALLLAIKYKNDLFSRTGKWASIFLIGLLILGIIFSANLEEIERKKAKEDMEKTEQELEELVENTNNKETEELPNIYESTNDEESSGLPNIYVSSNDKEIMSMSGSAYWSEVVDGKTVSAIYDGIDPRDGNYRDSFTINSQETINIKTDYKVSNVEIQSINKDNNEKYKVQYDTKTKNISFNNIEDGMYVVTYKIENNSDYAYYSFKVEVKQ